MISFMADKVKVSGPNIDGGFSVTLYVGEYEQPRIAELVQLPQGELLGVTIQPQSERIEHTAPEETRPPGAVQSLPADGEGNAEH